ncbi:MAG: hypothetical protein RIC15_01545 [Vicingaceae bacterium]
MKKVLIIYPHWPPSNLTGVHRPRLIANFLEDENWQPIILTVDSRYYEELLEPSLCNTVKKGMRVEYTKAFNIGRPRIIGDIGLRSYFFLLRRAKELLAIEKIDFIWIPIPSFYVALLGRNLYKRYKVPYGIDYIDPWVRDISNRKDLRHRLSNIAAKVLEPLAVRHASLISGVNADYYRDVLLRNFVKEFENTDVQEKRIFYNRHTQGQCIHVDMPYGFDQNDYKAVEQDFSADWLSVNAKNWIYAGAFLPKSDVFLKSLFKAFKELHAKAPTLFNIRFIFIGTGTYVHKSVRQHAIESGVSDFVLELPERMPYLKVLSVLKRADMIMILGSTEAHYTASKVFQSVLSQRPIFGIMHKRSSAGNILEEVGASKFVVHYDPNRADSLDADVMQTLKLAANGGVKWEPDLTSLSNYSAAVSSRKLAKAMDKIISLNAKQKISGS